MRACYCYFVLRSCMFSLWCLSRVCVFVYVNMLYVFDVRVSCLIFVVLRVLEYLLFLLNMRIVLFVCCCVCVVCCCWLRVRFYLF